MSGVTSQDFSRQIRGALDVLARTQSPSGSWRGDYSGPLFLLPMYVGVCYVVRAMPDQATRDGMFDYLRRCQNEDGGWGLHDEGTSCVFSSVLNYVALRLLGVSKVDPVLSRARAWFLPRGGALSSASWGRFFLTLLNLHDYRGLDPVPPELWLLPESLPIHPSRLWCHCRMVYLPMSYLYGSRFQAPLDPLLKEIRDEIYAGPFAGIAWARSRDRIAATDAYRPRSLLYRGARGVLGFLEGLLPASIRRQSLTRVLDLIDYEDRTTNSICIGPVNKLFHTLVWHAVEPGGERLKRHLQQLPDYLSRDGHGVRMNGYNSSELWDTCFAVQAIAEAAPQLALSLPERATGCPSLLGAGQFIAAQQVLKNTPDHQRYYRDASKGGWPFSTREHGWPITDCTAEGIKATLALRQENTPALAVAVERILRWQNPDGGWATYERTRGPRWLEWLNPSDIFGDIMIDYSYVECTSACIQALEAYRSLAPRQVAQRLHRAVGRGARFIASQQRRDGSWEGSWGVCFTYGTWFGVWGMLAAGAPPTSPALKRACDFLESKQLPDGGWGETIESCRQRRYVSSTFGQPVRTSWALLTLLKIRGARDPVVERGLRFLLAQQREDGTWPDEPMVGVFNRTCAINYANYRKIFPLWTLSLGMGQDSHPARNG